MAERTTKQRMEDLIKNIEKRETKNKAETNEKFVELEESIEEFIDAVNNLEFIDKDTVGYMSFLFENTQDRLSEVEDKSDNNTKSISDLNGQVNKIKGTFIDKSLVVYEKKNASVYKEEDHKYEQLPACNHIPNDNPYDNRVFQLTKDQMGLNKILCECPPEYPVNAYSADDQNKHVACSTNFCSYGKENEEFYLYSEDNLCFIKEAAF